MRVAAQVTAIDVGYRNFAWCTLSAQGIVSHDKVDLWPLQANRRRHPTKTDLIRITRDWCMQHAQLLGESDLIVLENQIRDPFIVMNTVIQTLYFDKVTVAHPMTVGAYWQLPVKREAKKARGVKVALAHGVVLPPGKQDDLADTWLMARWALHQYYGN